MAEAAPGNSRPGPAVSRQITGFAAHLRMNGFRLGLSESRAALALVDHLGTDRPADCRLGLKVLLCSGTEDWNRFDDLFEAYWMRRGKTRDRVRQTNTSHVSDVRPTVWRDHFGETAKASGGTLDRVSDGDPDDGDPGDGAKSRLVASHQDTIRRTDLRHLSDPDEIAEAERVALRLARALRYRLSRRYRLERRPTRIDLRRTIRANLSRGGDPVTLIGRGRPSRPVEIVLFVDVSGSMQPYTRFFLQFVAGLVGAWPKSDAYLFHTRLVRVTEAVRERDPLKAMAKLALVAGGIGGGTKLGDSLARFNDVYAKSAINSRTVFVVFSDGYDTGSPDRLARELTRLKTRVRRLVWLNPLLGWRDYEPVTAAMAAARPHIDRFATAHTLDALAALETEWATL